MCTVLRVSRSGFYGWLHKPLSGRRIEDGRLFELIRHSYIGSGRVYGAPRVFGDLREAGETCGHNRVARIMRINRIRAIRGYKAHRRITGRPSIISPNRLQREFTVNARDKAWATLTLPTSGPGRDGSTWQWSSTLCSQGRGLVHEADARSGHCSRCLDDGGGAAPTNAERHRPFRSRPPHLPETWTA